MDTLALASFYQQTRQQTAKICFPLETEDYVVQPETFVSPPKWHLGHTTWFFETFVLLPFLDKYTPFDPDFAFVFNSYYETAGKRVMRADRGNLSRPTVDRIYSYRHNVDKHMDRLFATDLPQQVLDTIEIGTHHEKQHQELLCTDIKYILGHNPLLPSLVMDYEEFPVAKPTTWVQIHEGLYTIGHQTQGFCYDNELGVHQVFLPAFEIRSELVTQGEYLEFIEAGGYKHFGYWHAEAWDWVQNQGIEAPLYWHKIDGQWQHYTYSGLQPIDPKALLTHISYYEAYAFAQWAGYRLPTEFEWEAANEHVAWGQRWEWTESAYLPYPGYQKADGALGEYNGKFMVNQKVLRGASVATPAQHSRHTYRNFFQPDLRWQYTGIRLARHL
ncbi:ergothioneine biosynthesis protein EgtB [Sediminicola luteus]|uniref:Sulfatase maturase n=1 Tax=Sediminicola luteus TaxID=319238 RepID=A0A2A4G5N4_9FLAO|nr:ergothioneine biosynthesis protein EgtB [Sediminicola luteus]PCE63298.1 sulfatase maturase [Sediminicola luteus]